MVVYLVSGFWHGANWGFVFWGICHGLFSIITKQFGDFFKKMHPALNWILTFTFVNIMWIFFRAESLPLGIKIVEIILKCDFGPIRYEILECFKLPEITYIMKNMVIEDTYPYFVLVAFYITAFLLVLGSKNAYEKMQEFKPTIKNAITISFLIVWCIFSFNGISTFLYFNF